MTRSREGCQRFGNGEAAGGLLRAGCRGGHRFVTYGIGGWDMHEDLYGHLAVTVPLRGVGPCPPCSRPSPARPAGDDVGRRDRRVRPDAPDQSASQTRPRPLAARDVRAVRRGRRAERRRRVPATTWGKVPPTWPSRPTTWPPRSSSAGHSTIKRNTTRTAGGRS